jgi:hypothetical protein
MYETVMSDFFIGFSEILLILITSMLITGRKEILNIRNKINLLKLFLVALVLTLIIMLTKDLLGQFSTIAMMAVIIVICAFIFKIHWTEAAAGVLIATVSLAAFEYVSILISSKITGVAFNGNTIVGKFRMYTSIASRILQTILIFILYRSPTTGINFGAIKGFAKKTLRRLTFIYIYEAFCIIILIKIGWSQLYSGTILSILDMSVNIILICSFFILNIIIITKLMRNAMLEKKNNTITLLWFKHLLTQYKYDIAKIDEMVDAALNKEVEGGKYDEK